MGFPASRLMRKDPQAQRALNFHMGPPHPGFPPHHGNGPFPQQYGLARPPLRMQTPMHPQAASFPPSFFSGPQMAHRGLQSPVLEGLEGGDVSMGPVSGGVSEDLKGVVRGLPPQAHQQPLRLNSFGEESLDSLLGDTLGKHICCVFFFYRSIGIPLPAFVMDWIGMLCYWRLVLIHVPDLGIPLVLCQRICENCNKDENKEACSQEIRVIKNKLNALNLSTF